MINYFIECLTQWINRNDNATRTLLAHQRAEMRIQFRWIDTSNTFACKILPFPQIFLASPGSVRSECVCCTERFAFFDID